MKQALRRCGIPVLAGLLIASPFGTLQAGLIPWLYDAIFGPAYPGGYYGHPAGIAACDPCRVPCGTVTGMAAPCSTGTFPATVAWYQPCGSACTTAGPCAARTTWKSSASGAASTGAKVPEPKLPEPADAAPRPSTFAEGDDGTTVQKSVPEPEAEGRAGWSGTGTGTPRAASDAESTPGAGGVTDPAAPSGDSAGFGDAVREAPGTSRETDAEPKFEPAIESGRTPAGSEPGGQAPILPDSVDPDLTKSLNLDGQSSLRNSLPWQRIVLRPGIRSVRLARHSVPVSADYVLPVETATRLVSR